MSAANALLRAIHLRLAGDAVLTALIGPDGIRDRLQTRPKLPAIVIGEMETRDLSTVTEPSVCIVQQRCKRLAPMFLLG